MSETLDDLPIAIDHRQLREGTGVSTYAASVEQGLNSQGISPFHIIARPYAREGSAGRVIRWLDAMLPAVRRLHRSERERSLEGSDIFRVAQVHLDIWNRPLRLRVPLPAGIVHWGYPVPMRIEGWINLYTIHDLIPFTDPDLTPINGIRHRRLLQAILAGCDGVITVSEASRAHIVAALPIDAERVWNCGSATANVADPAFEPGSRDYFLICGSIEPRKNIVRAVQAYSRSGAAQPLLIAGPDGWQSAEIRRATEGVAGVRWLPYMDRESLDRLIAGARTLLMPSLAEGFGLPVIEAMAMGTPVVTTNRGALSETAGNAAVLVDPMDITAISEVLARLGRDDRLVESLSAAGRTRAQAFSVDRFGSRLVDAYAAALAGSAKLRGS